MGKEGAVDMEGREGEREMERGYGGRNNLRKKRRINVFILYLLFPSWQLEREAERLVWSKVERSIQQSSREICEVLHHKQFYLNTLML